MKRLTLLVVIAASLLAAQQASAHVLINDDAKSQGAILHIIPDDDPIAGQSATLFFDTQGNLLQGSTVTLTIQDATGAAESVPTKTDGSLVTADYTFPTQGTYTVSYVVTGKDGTTYKFAQSQRVSRGTVGSALDKPTYAWAEMLAIGAGVTLTVLLLIAFNHRAGIAKYSRLQ